MGFFTFGRHKTTQGIPEAPQGPPRVAIGIATVLSGTHTQTHTHTHPRAGGMREAIEQF